MDQKSTAFKELGKGRLNTLHTEYKELGKGRVGTPQAACYSLLGDWVTIL